MIKQEEIKRIRLAIPQTIIAYDGNPKGQHLYIEQREEIAEAFYNAGYKQEKEVVKEILQPIYELCKVRKEITFDDLNFLVMKYGIELE